MCLLSRPAFEILLLTTLVFWSFSSAEIQQEFSIHMPENLVPIYERKISINIDNLPPISVTVPVSAEIISTDRLLKAQISDEISAINGEISATVLPSELNRIPLYNAPATTANIVGYTVAFTPISIIKFENGFAKLEISPEKACWIQNRFILSDTVKKAAAAKQDNLKLTIEQSLGIQRLMSVERRPWATAEYLSLSTGFGLCALGLSSFQDKQESAFRPAAQTVGISELICGGVLLYNLYQNTQTPITNYIYSKIQTEPNTIKTITHSRAFEIAEISSVLTLTQDINTININLCTSENYNQVTFILNGQQLGLTTSNVGWTTQATVPTTSAYITKIFCVKPDGKLLSVLRTICAE